MKSVKFATKILFITVMGMIFGTFMGVNAAYPMAALFVLSFAPMPSGVLPMAYDMFDIDKPAGSWPGAGGGIKSVVYAALEDDLVIASWPSRAADQATISSDIVLKAGKYLHQIYATEDTIEPNEKKLKGPNRDSGGFEVTLKFFHPGVEAAIQEFKAKHANSNFILLIKNCGENKVYLIGEPCNTAWLEDFETKWGKDVDEGKGTDFTFMCKQPKPVAIYSGALDTLLEPDSGSGSA